MSLQETVAAQLSEFDSATAYGERFTSTVHAVSGIIHSKHAELFSSASGVILQEGIGDESIPSLGFCPVEAITEAVEYGAIVERRGLRRPGSITLAYDGQRQDEKLYGWQVLISDKRDRSNRRLLRLDVSDIAMTAKLRRRDGQGVITQSLEGIDPVPVARLVGSLLSTGIVDRTVLQMTNRKAAIQATIDELLRKNEQEIATLRLTLEKFSELTQVNVVASVQEKHEKKLNEQRKLLDNIGFMPATIEQF
ncbi:MAG: hypothetical protein JWM81_489 [Candidatus Saccharibacteria bacterium]|nr:hypothetical protein [Candidatus Saccharibacteria bacterium]